MTTRIPPLGTLRDRVALKRKEMSPEAEGGHTVVYVPTATVWARVHSLKGRETREAGGRHARVSHSVVMRFRTDVKAGDRIVYRGRPLEVLSADDLNGRRAYLSCACAETSVIG